MGKTTRDESAGNVFETLKNSERITGGDFGGPKCESAAVGEPGTGCVGTFLSAAQKGEHARTACIGNRCFVHDLQPQFGNSAGIDNFIMLFKDIAHRAAQ